MPLRAKLTATTTIDKMASPLDSNSLQGQLEKAVLEGKIPQGVVFAATRDGSWYLVSIFYISGKDVYVMANMTAALIDWFALADLYSNGSQALSNSAMLLARLLSRRVLRISKKTLSSCSLRRLNC